MPCAKVGMLYAFLPMLRLFRATHCLVRAMLRLFLGMLHAFAATRCEDVDAIHEESPGHHALHSILFPVPTTPRQKRGHAVPSRERGSECIGSSPERETTRPGHVGMLRDYIGMLCEYAGMPNEDNTRPVTMRRW
jgi:hypothetical protein